MLSMRGEILRLEERRSGFNNDDGGVSQEGLAINDAEAPPSSKPAAEAEAEAEAEADGGEEAAGAPAIPDVMPLQATDFITDNPMHAAGFKSATAEKASAEAKENKTHKQVDNDIIDSL